MAITFTVNSRTVSTDAPPATPLLWVIREGLKGAVEQSNFYDYQVMRMNDLPDMHIELIPTDNHPTGVGQMASARDANDAGAGKEGAGLKRDAFSSNRHLALAY